MYKMMKKIGKISSFLTKYIGVIIIIFSVLAFFWRDGFECGESGNSGGSYPAPV